MYSSRFDCEVVITRHASDRMRQRQVSEGDLLKVVEGGERRYKDSHRLWVAANLPMRDDNMICAPVVLERGVLIVKTVMHHFSWEA